MSRARRAVDAALMAVTVILCIPVLIVAFLIVMGAALIEGPE